MIKIREDARFPPAQRTAELLQLRQALGHFGTDLSDLLLHGPPPDLWFRLPISINHALIHAPNQLHRLMLRHCEQVFNTLLLFPCGQRQAGAQRTLALTQRTILRATPPIVLTLHSLPGLVQHFGTELDHMKRIQDFYGLGQLLSSRRCEAGETVHRDHSNALLPVLILFSEPGLEHGFGTSGNHVD